MKKTDKLTNNELNIIIAILKKVKNHIDDNEALQEILESSINKLWKMTDFVNK